tara:strand:- start:182 stop:382 length:201 start_codon:yes stop_codon:yes gene_type:complete
MEGIAQLEDCALVKMETAFDYQLGLVFINKDGKKRQSVTRLGLGFHLSHTVDALRKLADALEKECN